MAAPRRLVTAAALILFLAFVSMAPSRRPTSRSWRPGWPPASSSTPPSSAPLLVPATVALMGRWNWWLPSWLDRHIPGAVPGAATHHPATADQTA